MTLPELNSYAGKRILVTGHTGFKGSWLIRTLKALDAEVFGLALEPEANSLYPNLGTPEIFGEALIDIRNRPEILNYFSKMRFDGIFHLAAQSLVRKSYVETVETFETNVMGTLNILDAVFTSASAKWVVVVTTDKVYKNIESLEGYKEDAPLGGTDPYSASKAACEMVVSAYQNLAKLDGNNLQIVSVRSGNVIGGGDTAKDRLLPDIIRSFQTSEQIVIRSPSAIRPWQHVLDPLTGYLLVGQKLLTGHGVSSALNFGPDLRSRLTVEEMVRIACSSWPFSAGYKVEENLTKYPETGVLWLDSSKARNELGWTNKLDAVESINWTLDWERSLATISAKEAIDRQIQKYFAISK